MNHPDKENRVIVLSFQILNMAPTEINKELQVTAAKILLDFIRPKEKTNILLPQ